MNNSNHTAIIGGGASGLTAAIVAKRTNPEKRIILLEKKDEVGKKLKASGNGRGNLSNLACSDGEDVRAFLNSCGILLRCDEEGRFYPYSEDAGSVVSTLKREALELGCEIHTGCEVKNVVKAEKEGPDFTVKYSDEKGKTVFLEADKVLIATGGKSYPVYGTTGDGFVFARAFGHRVEAPIPALTAVEVEENIKSLKGIRAKGVCRLLSDDKVIYEDSGEIQFREDSISGICIMNLSNHVGRDKYVISLDLVPGLTENELGNYRPESILKPALFSYIRKKGDSLKDFRMTVKGLKGWKEAQVTRGGVSYSEINSDTMESLIVPGLYFSGEVMDFAGICGGFNLNHAFSCGIKAGKAMAE